MTDVYKYLALDGRKESIQMREDMNRVLVTTGRRKSYEGETLRARRNRVDPEEAPTKASMRPKALLGWDCKHNQLGEYLGPLKRFINAQVGRNWDTVYAEIRANIDPGNAVQAHILQHLYGYIEAKCYWKDGVLYTNNFYGDGRSYSPTRVGPGDLYVCPKSGIIRKMKTRHYQRRKVEPKKLENNGKNYEKIEGLWYEIISTYQEQRGPRWVVRKPYNKPDHPGTRTLETYWPREKILITKKRQLNSKELRRLGVKND